MRFRCGASALAGGACVALLAGCNLGIAAKTYTLPAGVSTAGDLAAGDLDGDGDLDLVASVTGGVAVARNDGAGIFALEYTPTSEPWTIYNGDLDLGDVDGDDDLDAVHGGPDGPVIRLGDGDGGFTDPGMPLPAAAAPSLHTYQPLLRDLDRDGDLDALAQVGGQYDTSFYTWKNGGTGAFGPATEISSVTLPAPDYDLADLNGDEVPDLVVTKVFEGPRGVAVALGAGDGTFGPEVPSPTGFDGLDAFEVLALGDATGDGRVDAVVTHNDHAAEGETSLVVLPGTGGAAFGAPIGTFVPNASNDGDNRPTLADFDGDGHLDVVLKRRVRFGAGDGTFPRDRSIASGDGTVAADFDGDGAPDIAYAAPDHLVVMRNGL